ncbi:MAG: DJ-1/PfpI family protein [Sedimentisphaerales bacterium]|nr:DJ-1/PfpI family protein [Sedimentisphaerales bacterium]
MRRRTTAAPRLKTVQLPESSTGGTISVEQALLGQQRLPTPADQRLEPSAVGQLAWAAQGVRVPRAASTATTPNPLPLLKVYFVLPDGVYSYNPADHSLEQISLDDERRTMAMALVNRPDAPIGGAQIILAGSLREFGTQYGVQARTTMLLQAGQAAQSIQLQAMGLGLTYLSIENVNTNVVRRVARMAKGLDPAYVIFVGYPSNQTPVTTVEPSTITSPANKRVLLVVPPQAFQDQELYETKRALELAGVPVQVASTRLTSLTGVLGGTANADLLLNQAKIGDYAGVVFIGGPGVAEYLINAAALNLARQAADQRKVVAAIGTAPTILAKAGILKGARVTGYLPEQARIVQGGAIYTGYPVEKDGLTITATSAPAIPLFVQAIVEGLGQTK